MRRVSVIIGSAFAACISTFAMASEPNLVIGDTIEVSVVGIENTQKRTIVDENGMISYPLLGLIKAEGLTQEVLRQKLAEQLVNSALFKDPRVSIELINRPPFYVTGDVGKPGVQPYAPNMTVHTAVALAGSADPLSTEARGKGLKAEAVRDQVENAAFDFVRNRAHLIRLEAELAGKPTVPLEKFSNLPIATDVVANLNALEIQDFDARHDEVRKEKVFLKSVIEKVKKQIEALIQRRNAQQNVIRDRENELAKFKELADRGVIVQGRVLDEQRAMSVLKSGLYDSVAQEAQVGLLLEDYEHKLASIDQTRKLVVIKEVGDAYIAAAASESRLNSARKLMNVQRSGAASYIVFRRNNGAQVRLEVNEWAIVQPGDMIEVKLGAGTEVAAH